MNDEAYEEMLDVSIPLRKFRKAAYPPFVHSRPVVSIPLRKFRKKRYMEYIDMNEKTGFHPSKEV